MRPLDLIIFQVPTIGQSPDVLNKIMRTVKGYKSLLVRLETWVVIEQADEPSKYYTYADRIIVVPKAFSVMRKPKLGRLNTQGGIESS
jgi:hypothetical protein